MRLRKLIRFIDNIWSTWRWRLWRAAVVRAATKDFAQTIPVHASLDAEEWVDANESALKWWFYDGATPAEAFVAVTEENNDGW